jgi:hypothetical protein
LLRYGALASRRALRGQLVSALVALGDAAARPAFLESLKGRDYWYEYEAAAQLTMNLDGAPARWSDPRPNGYPLGGGTVEAHAVALAKWTGLPFEVDPSAQGLGWFDLRVRTYRPLVALRYLAGHTISFAWDRDHFVVVSNRKAFALLASGSR